MVIRPTPKPLPEPLRLPRGSVRGLLALFVAATFGYLLVRGAVPVVSVILNSVIVVIAFYYGGGIRAQAPATVGEGAARPSAPMRRRGMQVVLLIGFAGLTGWFLRANPSLAGLPPELQEIWQVLGGYLVGLSLAWIVHRRAYETPFRRTLAIIFRDISAATSLGLTAAVCVAFATGQQGLLAGYAEQALSLIITYYFGSRVIR